jgi:hypothetical protein
VVYVVPTCKVDAVMLATFILVEGIHWIIYNICFSVVACFCILHD